MKEIVVISIMFRPKAGSTGDLTVGEVVTICPARKKCDERKFSYDFQMGNWVSI